MECASEMLGFFTDDSGDSSLISATIFYAPSMVLNGMVSSHLYRNLHGTKWKSQMFLSGLFIGVKSLNLREKIPNFNLDSFLFLFIFLLDDSNGLWLHPYYPFHHLAHHHRVQYVHLPGCHSWGLHEQNYTENRKK